MDVPVLDHGIKNILNNDESESDYSSEEYITTNQDHVMEDFTNIVYHIPHN